MTPDKKFVFAVFDELFGSNFERYKTSLSKPVNDDVDPYARARNSLAVLSDAQRADVFDFFKIIIADSASVVLGALDGVHFPNDLEGEFGVTCDGEEIQGDFMDIFIEKAQEENIYG